MTGSRRQTKAAKPAKAKQASESASQGLSLILRTVRTQRLSSRRGHGLVCFLKRSLRLRQKPQRNNRRMLFGRFSHQAGNCPGAELSASHCYLSPPLGRSYSRGARPELLSGGG